MRGVFVDANEALAVIMERLEKPGDPKVRIHRDPDIKPEQYPEILDGAEIAIVDHTALPTEVAKKCAGLKDVVSLHLLLNDETRGMIPRETTAKMKRGVILINTARAAVVDEAAMIDALKSGHIRHAGLDVFNIEPLPGDHPLTKLPNVTLSAHSAFRTPEASENLMRAAWEHCRRIVKHS